MATFEIKSHYPEDEARQLLWEFFSVSFTPHWALKQDKIEVQRFCTPAEECLDKVRRHQKQIHRILIESLIYCSLVAVAYLFWTTLWISIPAVVGAIFFFIRVIIGAWDTKKSRPGKTIFDVAQEWAKTKKKILHSGLLESLVATLQYGASKLVNIIPQNHDWMDRFRSVTNHALTKKGEELGVAETEQDEPARTRIRVQYEELFNLAKFFEAIEASVPFGHYLPAKSK